ncbi:hypothetical protein ACX27_02875 [Nostoc piscinale CENA21]|uniref:Glutathione S-transferase n=1 Tax=Nostoc piscinale CENA21 TaxID=224013 RepID=A0A0M4SUG6_9NOSO|nr:glutathione S-transferase family protein [Nostoc piscinale]ALF52034.1 hypothetical protein ACX27_02875 [Nostoc piscinale CENA21]
MITLYKTPPLWGLPSFSPACMKLETWLRMAKLNYQSDTSLNFAIAPKGKIPFIEYQGKLIGDSTLIIEMFKLEAGIDLDANLTPTERAISLAFRRMIKENIYWGEAYIRYQVPENWQVYREALINILSPVVLAAECELIVADACETICTQLYNQGMGRHSDQEIYQIITADFQALSDFLADKLFFMGEQPTTLDATAYAYVGNLIKPSLKHSIVDYVLQLENLCQHYERMNQLFFSDSEV